MLCCFCSQHTFTRGIPRNSIYKYICQHLNHNKVFTIKSVLVQYLSHTQFVQVIFIFLLFVRFTFQDNILIIWGDYKETKKKHVELFEQIVPCCTYADVCVCAVCTYIVFGLCIYNFCSNYSDFIRFRITIWQLQIYKVIFFSIAHLPFLSFPPLPLYSYLFRHYILDMAVVYTVYNIHSICCSVYANVSTLPDSG